MPASSLIPAFQLELQPSSLQAQGLRRIRHAEVISVGLPAAHTTALTNLLARREDPVVEQIRLIQARAVLLDSSSPDLLVRIRVQRRFPFVHCFLKIAPMTAIRIVPLPERDSQMEVRRSISGLQRSRVGRLRWSR